MFTGIIQFLGVIARTERRQGGMSLLVTLPDSWSKEWRTLPEPGESICVDGACLTMERAVDSLTLAFFTSDETLAKTTLGARRPGDAVNLERSATLQSLLGGHLVSGHVDGRGELRAIREKGDTRIATFQIPALLSRYVVEKGSIAIDGISLTAVDVRGDQFDVWVIPHTWASTTLIRRRPGDQVNIECDLIAKMVEKQLMAWRQGPATEGAAGGRNLEELLKQAGFQR